MNDKKRFTMIDESFICLNCGKRVEALGYTARDHCPFCLWSLHIDVLPGDRACDCKGLLKPIGIEKARDSFKILYQCTKCGYEHKNIMAQDDDMATVINVSRREQ